VTDGVTGQLPEVAAMQVPEKKLEVQESALEDQLRVVEPPLVTIGFGFAEMFTVVEERLETMRLNVIERGAEPPVPVMVIG
jgi:hypothetical protein